jgi:hypothetical protein
MVTVNSYSDPGFDIRQHRTYQWEAADAEATGDPRLDNNRFFDERMRAQVEKELAKRGFEKTESRTPDLFVHYHARVTQKIDIRHIDRTYAYADVDRGPYIHDAGTLFVDLVDPRTNKLVWRGWAEGSVEGVIDSQQWMEQHIDKAVAQIVARLPRGW